MSLISLIFALAIEQFRPIAYARWVLAPVRATAAYCERRVNAGEPQHGVLGWLMLTGGAVFIAGAGYYLLRSIHPVIGLVWNVLVLYVTMGFRQFSHHYTEIHLALRMGELDRARSLLAAWRGTPQQMWSSSDIARLSIEMALLASHRHVFAVLFWFVVLPGPIGAVLYRMAMLLAEIWREDAPGLNYFGSFARKSFAVIDWLPQRLTAAGFAIVGDFEDAVHCWRTQAADWVDQSAGIVLAAGAGALGVRLGMPVTEQGELNVRQGLGTGADADVDFMQSAIGLVWRALVLWLLLLFMLSLASLVG